MALVYASDVKHDGEFVKKRGDKFVTADAEKYFDVEPEQLLEDGIVVQEAALPENADDVRSTSFYELQAQMLRESEEALKDSSPGAQAQKVVEHQGKTTASTKAEEKSK